MKVKELIQELLKYSPEQEVNIVVCGKDDILDNHAVIEGVFYDYEGEAEKGIKVDVDIYVKMV